MSNIAEQINILIEVQSVEREILQAGRQLDALHDEALSLDQEAAARETLVADEKMALDDLKKSYRELESESKVHREMIVKSNEKLRAVKTNKEYQSILKEIEELEESPNTTGQGAP
jgi:predicted  nucleic acid-binding Zn-ribbon protein